MIQNTIIYKKKLQSIKNYYLRLHQNYLPLKYFKTTPTFKHFNNL